MESSRAHGKRSLKFKIEEEEEEDEEEQEEEEEEEEEDEDEDERRKRVMMMRNTTTSSKRGSGAGGSTTARPCCQANNCNADLSDEKQYYRRHKVCPSHAKAAAVLVAGLQQRFCQQCSRFHNLSEFDDSKRSCRRRLAGHNERRRKSSTEYHGEVSN